jgi:hypothetical protein
MSGGRRRKHELQLNLSQHCVQGRRLEETRRFYINECQAKADS